MELRKEKSCGCIIIKENKVLLIFQKDDKFWGFPKGHMEEGETELETAAREVKEEVGLDVEIDANNRYVLNYIVDNEIDKTTVLYTAIPKSNDVVIQESEVEEAKWFEFNEALDMLNFDNWKEILKKVIELKEG